MRRHAHLYAWFITVGFLAAGTIGFFYNGDFSTGPSVTRDAVFGLLDTNGWHNVFHLALGAVAYWASWRTGRAWRFALTGGALYVVMGVAGLVLGDDAVLVGLMPVNIADSLVHLALGLAGLGAAWLAGTPRRTARPGALPGKAEGMATAR